jgi:FkbM family methyltransferase
MNFLEKIKLRHRALKYKNRDDKGGISYINNSVKKGDTIFDIGAHKAGYLYFMEQNVGKDGKIYAFEPQSLLYAYLVKIKDIMHWGNITIEKIAMSDNEGSVTLFIPSNKTGQSTSPSATILENNTLGHVSNTETVLTTTLDIYCLNYNIQPNLLKIDVEGNELKVFQGGVHILKNFKPKIIVEIESLHVGQSKALETFEFLKNLGYEGKVVHDDGQFPLSDFSFEKYQNKEDMKNYCNNFIFE